MLPLQFGYWKIRGLMQPIRLVCEYARLPWEEKTYTLKVTGNGCFDASEWKQVKHTLSLDFPNLPWFIDPNTGVKLTQSDAILRYIARQYKPELLGKTIEQQTSVDVISGTINDLKLQLARVAYLPKNEYSAAREALIPTVRRQFNAFQRYLTQHRLFMAGNNDVTFVDFVCYEVFDVVQHMLPELEQMRQAPLADYLQRIEALPHVKEYMASPRFLSYPINNACAAFQG